MSGATGTGCFEHNHEHLAAELARLDLLLRLGVAGARRHWASRPEATGGHLFIGDAEVDWLLSGSRERGPGAADGIELRGRIVECERGLEDGVEESQRRGIFLGLPSLGRLFGLSRFELDVVLLCLAPELRRRYDRVYAYLQDDITRQRPSVDLILDLLCEDEAERWSARAVLGPQADLMQLGILQTVEDPQSPSGSSGLAQFLKLDPRILDYLLGRSAVDSRLASLVRVGHAATAMPDLAVEPDVKTALLGLARRWSASPAGVRPRVVVDLNGPVGVGKLDLAVAVCHELGCAMLVLDVRRLPTHPDDAEPLLRLACRESLLLQAPLYIAPASVFIREGEHVPALRGALARTVEAFGWLTFLAGEVPWPYRDLFQATAFHQVPVPLPGVPVREDAWRRAIDRALPGSRTADLVPPLADRFALTPAQIREAATAVAHQRTLADTDSPVTFEALSAACRAQAHHSLGGLASKVEPCHGWDDLVLPADKEAQLRELCSQVRHRHLVYERWGFGRKLTRGRGISALFSGPPGTGKTMAAEVIAGDLQLDLYAIDLARVVSKYIGETEKNLSRIFAEAEHSNAILFFDEADALFGKRTEVSDAHDRYANIETSFLLQRMEEYTGVIILASNLSENMDDAFLRRIRFVVEFPFPDAASRLAIWKAHFPGDAPVEAVDYQVLADRIPVAGGNIKNIALAGAFYAAADGGVIRMEHVLHGARREFEKIGKLWDEPGR